MIGQATAALHRGARRIIHQMWGVPDMHTRQKWAALWPQLAALNPTGIRLLDAGCGRGQWALELAARRPGWKVLGIDFDHAVLAEAEEHRRRLSLDNLGFVRADFRTFQTARAFDLVLSVAAAHYLVASGQGSLLFAQFHAWLAAQGTLLLLAPRVATENPLTACLPVSHRWPVFRRAEIERLCAEADLDIAQLSALVGTAGAVAKACARLADSGPAMRILSRTMYPLQIAATMVDAARPLTQAQRSVYWVLVARPVSTP